MKESEGCGRKTMSDYIKREDAIFIALQQPLYSVVSQIKQLDGIDLEKDYVPRDYYEKVVEELCHKHTEEIANMPEFAPWKDAYDKMDCGWK